jgi:hypothetical protein
MAASRSTRNQSFAFLIASLVRNAQSPTGLPHGTKELWGPSPVDVQYHRTSCTHNRTLIHGKAEFVCSNSCKTSRRHTCHCRTARLIVSMPNFAFGYRALLTHVGLHAGAHEGFQSWPLLPGSLTSPMVWVKDVRSHVVYPDPHLPSSTQALSAWPRPDAPTV